MVFFNYALRKLNAKIVYYGPGLCGKTTNLQWIHDHFDGGQRGKMISLATEGDRTIFFDLLPIEIGTIRGMEVTLQLYTVPGQVHYNSTRQLVLRGADGVVFVADSQRSMKKSNSESLKNLQENLLLQGIEFTEFPHVLQFNKQDLRDLLSIEELDSDLNIHRCPFFEAVAVNGIGVQETLEGIVKLVMRKLRDRYETGSPGGPRPAGAGAGAGPRPMGGPKPMGMPQPAPMPPKPAPAPPAAAFEAPEPEPTMPVMSPLEPEPTMPVMSPLEPEPTMPVMPPLEAEPEPEPTMPALPPLDPTPELGIEADVPAVEDASDRPFESPSTAFEPPVVAYTENDDDEVDQDNVTTAVFGDAIAEGAVDPSTFPTVEEVEPVSAFPEHDGIDDIDDNEITSGGILIEDDDEDDEFAVDLVVESPEDIDDEVFGVPSEEIEVEPIEVEPIEVEPIESTGDAEPIEVFGADEFENVDEFIDLEPIQSVDVDSYLAADEVIPPEKDESDGLNVDLSYDGAAQPEDQVFGVEELVAEAKEKTKSQADAVDAFFEAKTDTGILYPPEEEDLEEEFGEDSELAGDNAAADGNEQEDPFSLDRFVDQVKAPGPFSTVKPDEEAVAAEAKVFDTDDRAPITQNIDTSGMQFDAEASDSEDGAQVEDDFGSDRPFETAPLDPTTFSVDADMMAADKMAADSEVFSEAPAEESTEPDVDEEYGFSTVSAESPDALAEMMKSRDAEVEATVFEDEVSEVAADKSGDVFSFGGEDPFAFAPEGSPVSKEILPEVVVEKPHSTPRIEIGPNDNRLALRLQGTGAIAEAGQMREIEVEVPVPGAWIGNQKVTLSLRLTLVPSAEGGDDGADSAS